MPSLVHVLLPSARPDWPAFDARLAELVVQSARRLRGQPGYPIRLTMATIGRDLEALEPILRHLEMLPQTAAALARVVETEAAFVTRVLAWMIDHDPQLCDCDHYAHFIRLTGLGSYAQISHLSEIITNAFVNLKTQRPPQVIPGVDWAARDRELSPVIAKAVTILTNQSDPWVRITMSAIRRVIDEAELTDISTSCLIDALEKLPQTDRVIKESVESWEQFQQRRLVGVAEQFRQQGLQPTRKQLLQGACRGLVRSSSQIEQTIAEILDSLAHLPSTLQAAQKARWETIDAQLSELIEPAARQMKAQTDPFVWVTRRSLGRHLDTYFLTEWEPGKLPQTAAALARVVETREEFAIRRLQWFGADYRHRQVRPFKWQLIKEARAVDMYKRPRIQAVVAEVLQTLSSFPLSTGSDES